MSNPDQAHAKAYLGEEAKPQSSVVLIDEIDKAPKDFPNDLLQEIENLKFKVKETGHELEAGLQQHIIVIMTSNSEKALPDAFLRRCVFHHIDMPTPTELEAIVKKRLPAMAEKDQAGNLERAIAFFLDLQGRAKRREPATAELLAWLQLLLDRKLFEQQVNFRSPTSEQKSLLQYGYAVLAKTKEDLDAMKGK